MDKHYTLSQLSLIIKEVFSISLPDFIWVKGEISECNENRSGHCYLELIEKNDERIVARFRAIVWDRTYRMLKPYFEQTTNTELKAGISILIKVKVEYSELYGISLIIYDIDPSYTLGNLELQRALVLQRLMSDGVLEMNKQISFPLVPQRIAVISSETAAGFQDFTHHLDNNNYNFKFEVELFKAYMQGEEAESSIIEALDKINEGNFDVVVITRGGGSRSDLACFDKYDLAFHICQFPLPIISAIGHERDISVIDIVAHTRVKTPTAAAHFLIEKTLQYWTNVLQLYENIIHTASDLVSNEEYFLQNSLNKLTNIKYLLNNIEHNLIRISDKIHQNTILQVSSQQMYLSTISQKLKNVTNNVIEKKHNDTSQYVTAINKKYQLLINAELQKLQYAEKYIKTNDPINILKKGFSITKKNDISVKSIKEIKSGDEIKTILHDGEFKSYVK